MPKATAPSKNRAEHLAGVVKRLKRDLEFRKSMLLNNDKEFFSFPKVSLNHPMQILNKMIKVTNTADAKVSDDPTIRGIPAWTPEEDRTIVESIKRYGKNFALITDIVNLLSPWYARSVSHVMNRWNWVLEPRLLGRPTRDKSKTYTPNTKPLVAIVKKYKESSPSFDKIPQSRDRVSAGSTLIEAQKRANIPIVPEHSMQAISPPRRNVVSAIHPINPNIMIKRQRRSARLQNKAKAQAAAIGDVKINGMLTRPNMGMRGNRLSPNAQNQASAASARTMPSVASKGFAMPSRTQTARPVQGRPGFGGNQRHMVTRGNAAAAMTRGMNNTNMHGTRSASAARAGITNMGRPVNSAASANAGVPSMTTRTASLHRGMPPSTAANPSTPHGVVLTRGNAQNPGLGGQPRMRGTMGGMTGIKVQPAVPVTGTRARGVMNNSAPIQRRGNPHATQQRALSPRGMQLSPMAVASPVSPLGYPTSPRNVPSPHGMQMSPRGAPSPGFSPNHQHPHMTRNTTNRMGVRQSPGVDPNGGNSWTVRTAPAGANTRGSMPVTMPVGHMNTNMHGVQPMDIDPNTNGVGRRNDGAQGFPDRF